MQEKMIEEIEKEVKKGKFEVVVDCINVSKIMRQSYIKLVKAGSTSIVVVHFDFSKELTLHINNFKWGNQEVQEESGGYRGRRRCKSEGKN